MTASPSGTSVRGTVVVLAVVAVALYAPLVGWGLPHATAPERTKTVATDEILPLEGLAEMRSTFVSPAPDRNLGYPWWHYFVVSVAQAPYLAVLEFSGGLSQPSPVYPFGLSDPVKSLRVLTILGRLVSVAMGAGIVVAAFFFSRALWGDAAGVIAAVLTMLSYPMFYYSRTGNLDVPAFFWSALGFAVLARILTSGLTTRRAAWLGCFIALAAATKDQAAALFVPLVLVLVWPRFNHPKGRPYQVAPLVALLLAGLVAYVIGTGMFIDPHRHMQHVSAIFFNQGQVSDGAIYYPPAPRTWSGTARLLKDFGLGLAGMMSWPVLIVAAAGVVVAAREAKWQLIWLVPVASTFLFVMRVLGLVILRYLLPLTLIVDAFAALALIRVRRSHPLVSTVLLVVLVGWRLAVGADLSYAQIHDTRYDAAAWIRTHYRTGEVLEYFSGPDRLPAMDAEVVSRSIMGRPRVPGEPDRGPAILKYLSAEGPAYVLEMPDWTSRDADYSQDCPPEVYAALMDGSAGYRLVAYFPTPSLLPAGYRRPRLDYPTVAPPVRIFARVK